MYARLFLFLMLGAALNAGDHEHTVQSGDTVYSLARRYGVKAEEILFLNGIEDARKIMAGQTLRIPSGPIMAEPISSAPAAPKPVVVEHKVIKGDTLFALARTYHVGVQSVLDANGFSKNKMLKIGETVKIPLPPSSVAAAGKSAAAAAAAVPASKSAPPAAAAKPLPPKPAASLPPFPPSAARAVDTRLKWPVLIKEAAYMTGKLDGVVLTGEKAAPVQSLSAGTIASAGPYRGFGKVAIVQSDTGYIYVYGGCETLSVRAGERITPGTELGRLGLDAVSQKPQLFFMVYNGSQAIDPAKAPRT